MPEHKTSWTEKIICPECDSVQDATVTQEEGWPFPAYVHTCTSCQYIITESEWSKANDNKRWTCPDCGRVPVAHERHERCYLGAALRK